MALTFYARPGGRHVHISMSCTIINQPRFGDQGYHEIDIHDKQFDHFLPCACVYVNIGMKRRLSIEDLRVQANKYERRKP